MTVLAAISELGFAIIPGVLRDDAIASLLQSVDASGCSDAMIRRGGIRNVLESVPQFRQVAESAAIGELIEPFMGRNAAIVRGILFDKTPEANWKVPWHQDLTIAVQRKVDLPGFGPWTVKDGVTHVQPPVAVLENILAVRIHLDDCGEDNGPVRVIPGSHSNGRLTDEQTAAIVAASPSVSCCVGRGGVLLMRPLLLHASSVAASPNHRRVLHLAGCEPPVGLRWIY